MILFKAMENGYLNVCSANITTNKTASPGDCGVADTESCSTPSTTPSSSPGCCWIAASLPSPSSLTSLAGECSGDVAGVGAIEPSGLQGKRVETKRQYRTMSYKLSKMFIKPLQKLQLKTTKKLNTTLPVSINKISALLAAGRLCGGGRGVGLCPWGWASPRGTQRWASVGGGAGSRIRSGGAWVRRLTTWCWSSHPLKNS